MIVSYIFFIVELNNFLKKSKSVFYFGNFPVFFLYMPNVGYDKLYIPSSGPSSK